MQTLPQDKQLISYLLGELTGEQREGLEERFCHDADLFERMLALRDDLIDDYLRGQLPSQQLRQFERYFLATPQQRERIENARALMRAIAAEPAAETPAPARVEAEPISFWQQLRDLIRDNRMTIGLAFSMALLMITVTGSLIFEMMRLRNQLTQVRQQEQEMQQQIAKERSRADGLAEELAIARTEGAQPDTTPSPSPEGEVIASLILTSDYDQGSKGPRGSGGLQKLVIPSDRGLVQLRLKLADASYRSYRVTLREVSSGKTVQTLEGLRAHPTRSGKAVIAKFPASIFSGPAKDYLVVLDGRTAEGKYETEIDKYSFQADKK